MKQNAKICVYAICKNESKFIDRWVESLKGEADCAVVLDTGSTDDSVDKLKKYSPFVRVEQYDYFTNDNIFRFDKARNDSMKLIPYDANICVILDLDQVPRKGWANLVRDLFMQGYNEVYGQIIDHSDEGVELNRWMSRNVHSNDPCWYWEKIIHEGIQYHGVDGGDKPVYAENFIIDHYPDNTNKDRSLYKKLLEYACKEYPKDPYYGIFLGIELSRRYSEEEAAVAFKRCIDECDFTDNEDIHYQTYINYASCKCTDRHIALQYLHEAEKLGFKTRRLYKTKADIYEELGDYNKAIDALQEALSVESYSSDWRDDAGYFGSYIEDRLSLFYYYQKHDCLKATEYCIKALQKDPDNQRIQNNLDFYYKAIKEEWRARNGQ